MAVSRSPYGLWRRLGLDWMLVTVLVMAAALVIGSLIRTAPDTALDHFGTQLGGLRALDDRERLILFEDMDAQSDPSWSQGVRSTAIGPLGAVWLATDPGQPMSRDLALPDETTGALLSLDVIAIGDWQGSRLELALQGQPIWQQAFMSPAGVAMANQGATGTQAGIALRTRLSAPRMLGLEATGADQMSQRLSIDIAIDRPDPNLRLTIGPIANPTATGAAPAWAVDNLVLITRTEAP